MDVGQLGQHDIAICLTVAKSESEERGVDLSDYVALLLTHAFLHAVGLDHEESGAEADKFKAAEAEIMKSGGFREDSL
jgi:rRNA maturation RNase YbeY